MAALHVLRLSVHRHGPAARTCSSSGRRRSRELQHDVDIFDPDAFVAGVPHEWFARCGVRRPVFWHPEVDGPGFWSVTHYDDFVTVNRDARRSRRATARACPEHARGGPRAAADADAQHGPAAAHAAPAPHQQGLHAADGERARGPVRSARARSSTDVAERGECDFVVDVAAELPLQVIAELMGVPAGGPPQALRLVEPHDRRRRPGVRDHRGGHAVASMELSRYAAELADQKRANPSDDLISVLSQAEVDGERLTDLEIDLFFLLLAVAGNETTRNLISHGIARAARAPRPARDAASPTRRSWRSAIEEMLRWASPVMHFRRTATVRPRAARSGDQGRRQDRRSGTSRRTATRRCSPIRSRSTSTATAQRARRVRRRRPALLPRRQPRPHGDPRHVRGAARALPRHGAHGEVSRLRSNFINGIKHLPVAYSARKASTTDARDLIAAIAQFESATTQAGPGRADQILIGRRVAMWVMGPPGQWFGDPDACADPAPLGDWLFVDGRGHAAAGRLMATVSVPR